MKITPQDKIALGQFSNRDSAGRHFTALYPDAWLERMETAGYLRIARPTHEPTGLSYSQEHWHAETTETVADWFDSEGMLIGYQYLYDTDGEYLGDPLADLSA